LGKAIEQSIPDMWKMSSHNAAQAIGCADQIGSIQTGYDADVVILNAAAPEMVLATVSRGSVIYNS
ncbi:MAG: amidohydrolase family protein, partial [Anaerolineae bacterium]|nr:amidohydrolase family protein [Anaerolineae bacterium]